MELKTEKIEDWELHALEFDKDDAIIMKVIRGKLSNIQTKPGRKKKLEWQQKIAKAIKLERGSKPRKSSNHYAISLGLRFSRPKTQQQPLDVDNFIKPIFAGIAAGLFSKVDEFPENIDDFKSYDDSCFRYLFVERLDDNAKEEGIVIVVSGQNG